jgi:MinD superfamily P-loop ATPase
LDSEIGDKLEKLDGVEVKLHEDKCRLCKKCLDEVCMFQAISLKDDKISIDYDICKGCGICTHVCKFGAITIDYTDESIDNVVNRMDNLLEIRE